ncbi:MAG TPA: NAD-dependent epimerase/dehydratase family protein [Steroidobacteraceae bacterium]|jgi:nucleoside-diphosphate-sugar epimerase
MKESTRTALVIGVTGSIGRAVAAVLLSRGWQVRALHRDPGKSAKSIGLAVQWVQGDAMQLNDVVGAARGTSLIVHAANPPQYRNWRGLALPMLENTIAAAKIANARILMPGTVYNFGAEAPPVVDENSPHVPTTRKGQVRVEMESKLQQASLQGVRSIVVRAGDFFGPGAGNSWLTRGMVRSQNPARSVLYPGPAAVGHAWAYVPDLAETMVRLIECERPMGPYEVFHFRGHWFERGVEIVERACLARGAEHQQVKPFPWWAVKLASPFIDVCHEMLEMRYLWQIPLRLDNAKLRRLLGAEVHTPIDAALAATFGVSGTAAPSHAVS